MLGTISTLANAVGSGTNSSGGQRSRRFWLNATQPKLISVGVQPIHLLQWVKPKSTSRLPSSPTSCQLERSFIHLNLLETPNKSPLTLFLFDVGGSRHSLWFFLAVSRLTIVNTSSLVTISSQHSRNAIMASELASVWGLGLLLVSNTVCVFKPAFQHIR